MDDDEILALIAEAIDDSMDMDWTSSIGAKSVLRALRGAGLLPYQPSWENPDGPTAA